MRIVEKSKNGIAWRSRPSAKITAARRSARAARTDRDSPASPRRPIAKAIDTPTMNRKNGKTRSVGVQPCHSACWSGGYTYRHDPGLFTSTMPATVAPRNTSSERSRGAAAGALRPAAAPPVTTGARLPARSARRPRPGQVGHQLDRLVLLRGDRHAGDAAVRPRAVALADPRRRADQRAFVDEVVGHRGHRLVLAVREVEFLDARGGVSVAALDHHVVVEVL